MPPKKPAPVKAPVKPAAKAPVVKPAGRGTPAARGAPAGRGGPTKKGPAVQPGRFTTNICHLFYSVLVNLHRLFFGAPPQHGRNIGLIKMSLLFKSLFTSIYPFSHGFVPSHRFVFRVCRELQLNCSLFSLKKVGKTTFICQKIW